MSIFRSVGSVFPCREGFHRREMLRLGGLSLVGLTLPALLAREARASHPRRTTVRGRAKSCVLVFMEGGPSHIDLWDMKPQAPAEIRGEFRPIATSVPGLQICEHLPRLARQMHHLALVRSVTHGITDHNAGTYYTLTGRYPVDGSRLIVADRPANFPPFGAVCAKLRPTSQALPAFVHLPELMSNNGVNIAGQSAGFLGAAFDPFVAGDPSLPDYEVPGMAPALDVSAPRLERRDSLVQELDGPLGLTPSEPSLARMNTFYRQAFRLIRSPHARRAFDLSQEPMHVRERYGMDRGSDRDLEARQFGGLPHLGQCLLLTRRLIEAGVRLVTVCTGRRLDQAWDTHRDHFPLLKRSLCPPFDQAFSALLEDMAQRGLLEETLVVGLGEFGRTPKLGYVTSGAGAAPDGRDHWPYCYTALFAGAGISGGALVGSSDRQGAFPSQDPVSPEDIAATIYAALGIDGATEIHDNLSRPHTLCPGRPIRALLS